MKKQNNFVDSYIFFFFNKNILLCFVAVYFDVYGCQMNVSDTEIIWSILKKFGYSKSDDIDNSDIVLIVTCSIRENAEMKIRNKLEYLKGIKQKKKKHSMKIGLLGK